MPIRPISARGSEVRHSTIIRTVSSAGRKRKIGTPVPPARMPASITFRALNIPPKKVPVSTKFGGMT